MAASPVSVLLKFSPGNGAVVTHGGSSIVLGPSLVHAAPRMYQALQDGKNPMTVLDAELADPSADHSVVVVGMAPAATSFVLRGSGTELRVETPTGVVEDFPELQRGWRGGAVTKHSGWRVRVEQNEASINDDSNFVLVSGSAPASHVWHGEVSEFSLISSEIETTFAHDETSGDGSEHSAAIAHDPQAAVQDARQPVVSDETVPDAGRAAAEPPHEGSQTWQPRPAVPGATAVALSSNAQHFPPGSPANSMPSLPYVPMYAPTYGAYGLAEGESNEDLDATINDLKASREAHQAYMPWSPPTSQPGPQHQGFQQPASQQHTSQQPGPQQPGSLPPADSRQGAPAFERPPHPPAQYPPANGYGNSSNGFGRRGLTGTRQPSPVAAWAPQLSSNQGHVVTLTSSVVVGRTPSPDRAPDPTRTQVMQVRSPKSEISRSHLVVTFEGGAVHVWDLGSANGTVVMRGGTVQEPLHPMSAVTLARGDVIDLGDGALLWLA